MKPEEFKKIIRVIVQEELKRQLPALIPQVLTEILSGNKSAPVIMERHPVAKAPVTQQVRKQPVIEKPRELKKYTNNPLLNQILNETAANPRAIPQENNYIGYSEQPTMTSDTNLNISEDVSNDNEMMDFKMLNESSPVSQIPSTTNIVPKTEEQAKVLGKINRDFRSLMKSIDEKKKSGITPPMMT